jgi:hypothetical protein
MKGAAVIATAISVRWYSLIKMLSSALELRPVIEQYLSIVTDGKLKRHLATALRTQSHQLIGLERSEIQNVDDDVAMEILGELPQTALHAHNPRAIATIEPAEWDDASRIIEVSKGLRDVMTVIESDQFGTNADIWRGYLWLRRLNARNRDDQITQAWADAQKIWEHWESRSPTVPSQRQRETVIRSLQK